MSRNKVGQFSPFTQRYVRFQQHFTHVYRHNSFYRLLKNNTKSTRSKRKEKTRSYSSNQGEKNLFHCAKETISLHRFFFFFFLIQPNLSIADMLRSGHFMVAETFSWNRLNHGQTLIEKPGYSGHFCSGQSLQRTQFFGTTWKFLTEFSSSQGAPHIFCGEAKMSHGILHYLGSVDLSKCFYQLIVSIFIFSQFFVQQILPVGKVFIYLFIYLFKSLLTVGINDSQS